MWNNYNFVVLYLQREMQCPTFHGSNFGSMNRPDSYASISSEIRQGSLHASPFYKPFIPCGLVEISEWHFYLIESEFSSIRCRIVDSSNYGVSIGLGPSRAIIEYGLQSL